MKLDACPFCGSTDVEIRKTLYQRYYVDCKKCHGSGPMKHTEREAASSWNTRLDPLPEPQSVIDWGETRALCIQYRDEMAQGENTDSDTEHYIFESAMEAVFGTDIWTWVNGQL